MAINAAILFPVFAHAREKARETSSLSNLKQLALATLMYAQDHDEVFPPLADAAKTHASLMPYLREERVFTPPNKRATYIANAALSRKNLAIIPEPSNCLLFYESTPSSLGKRSVVFADGHAHTIPESEWLRVKARSDAQLPRNLR